MARVLSRKTLLWGTAVIFLLLTLATCYFGNTGARTAGGGGLSVKPAVSLEEAIRLVRTDFEIPDAYSDFNSGYNGNKGSQFWYLQWTVPGSFLFCKAIVNAADGDVVNFACNQTGSGAASPVINPGNTGSLRAPAVGIEQAREIASRLLGRVNAKHLAELRPLPDDIVSLNSPVTYTFQWERVVDGIPFPDNGVSVTVSGDDGRVVGYGLSWLQVTVPDAAGAISPERARQVFETAGMLELQYYQPPAPYQPASGTKDAGGAKQPVLLIYRLVHPSHGDIDAISGQPLVNALHDVLTGITAGTSTAKLSLPDKDLGYTLSPQELAEVHRIAGLKTQDEAAAAVKKWVPGADALFLQSASLGADYPSGAYVWSLALGTATVGKPANLSARVNAFTGELLAFSYDPVSQSGIHWLDRGGAQKMAGDFLRQVQPQRFQEVALAPDLSPAPSRWTLHSPVEYFTYQRVVNGIPFPDNCITVSVDTHARRLVNYQLVWTNTVFPEPWGALNQQQAYAAFLKTCPLSLQYIYDVHTGIVNLVYRPQAVHRITVPDLLDARNGTPLDYNGHPMAALASPYRFNDISGIPGAREIELLGQSGLFGEYGDAFHPGEPVTAASLFRAMLALKNGTGGFQAPDEEVLRTARDSGWLKEDLQPDSSVTREELARIVVRMIGLERAAMAPGIYSLPFADAGLLSPDDTGYVALAWGLGIIKEEGARFRPRQAVTRAEAATVLVRAFQ